VPTHTWWIDEPLIMGSGNPTCQDLDQFRADGFEVIFSFLQEEEQPPKYNKQAAVAAGWTIYSFPIKEDGVASLDQVSEFITCLKAQPKGLRVLMHCESGMGRTAFMAAAYWIAKGLAADNAITRVRKAVSDGGWITPEREDVLRRYVQLQGVGR
jgi:protein tyrosine phosphatase (PTP) superfamily phosphohydrolase (DUF442 family)